MTKRGRPKNPEDVIIKKQVLQIRLLGPEKRAFEDASKLAGLSLSSWCRERLRAQARKELRAEGKGVPF